MADSATVVLRDLTTGAGRTGLTVKRRWADDNFATDRETATEVSGKPGVYDLGDVPRKISKLWVNGAEDNSFGGTNGRYFPDNNDDVILRDGSVEFTGHQSHGGYRINSVGDPASGIDVGDRDYNDARYELKGAIPNLIPGNCLVVSDQLTGVAGKIYTTIQGAIDYAASLSPNESDYWKIFVYPHKNTVAGYSENLVFQASIKLIGMGLVKVSGSVSGASQYVACQNIQFQHSGNITFNNSIKLINCHVRLTGSSSAAITLDTVEAIGLGLMTTHANHSIVSNGNNNISGWTNKEFTHQESDKIYMSLLSINNFDIGGTPA